MILQSVIFPSRDRPEDTLLYYRSKGAVTVEDRKTVKLENHAEISFDTYFNSFSIYKWSEYTIVDNLSFSFLLSGTCRLEVFRLVQSEKGPARRQVKTEDFFREELHACQLNIPWGSFEGFYCVKITAMSENAVIANMTFCSVLSQVLEVKIGLVTCTYHREPFIKSNAALICSEIFEGPDTELNGHLELLVIDNGGSLKTSDFPDRRLRLYPNANTGGSGGFARGMAEVERRREEGFTHVLLMDDDIRFEPEVLRRTYALLACAKKKYETSFVGGAMLRNDVPYIQEESGAVWKGTLNALGKGLDLRTEEGILAAGKLSNADYNAWWFCCIPMSVIREKGLPMPFFIHGDDMEYGLRCKSGILQLNGICVWHDVFENKRGSSLEYYDIRNLLIVNALYCPGYSVYRECLGLIKHFIANIMRMRYRDVLLNIRGVQDFLRGPAWWKRQDIRKLNRQIMEEGYRFTPFSLSQAALPCVKDSYRAGSADLIRGVLTLGGLIMPKKKETLVVPCGITPFVYSRYKKAYLLDPESGQAIYVEFSLREAVGLLPKIAKTIGVFLLHHKKVSEAYKRQKAEFTGHSYWDRYC